MLRKVTAGMILEEQAKAQPDASFLTFTSNNRKWTYAEFNDEVNRVLHGLIKIGVRTGDIVGIMMPNRPEYLFCSYALRKLGAVEVGINGELRSQEISLMLVRAKPRVLFLDAAYANNMLTVEAGLPFIEIIVLVGDAPDKLSIETVSFDRVTTKNTNNPETIHSNDLDRSLMLLSGGTTGLSKGIMTSHRFAMCAAHGIVDTYKLTDRDRVYAPWPLHHGTASILDVYTTLLAGGQVILSPKFSTTRLFADFREHGATWMTALGILQKIMWNMEPTPKDKAHSMRFMWGGPLPIENNAFEARFGFPAYNCYGASDIGMVAYASSDDPPGSGGKIRRDYYEVCIADENDDPLPIGEIGEILIRPRIPGVILDEYFGTPELMVKACRSLWFHTGDLGCIDANDRISFTERTGSIIRRRGEFISPETVEQVIESHPVVTRCEVIGVESEMGEQDIAAFIIAKQGPMTSRDEILDFCREKLARWMVPDHIILTDEIPTSEANKPIVPKLRELFDKYKNEGLPK